MMFSRLRFIELVTLLLLMLPLEGTSCGAEPRSLVEGCKLELVASEPAIVTPIGLSFDKQGRLLVVESHTHKRGENYQGPTSDRVRMLSDSDGDGRFDHWQTFAEGFRHAMNLAVRADDGVYLVTRNAVHLLRDSDGNGVADVNDQIVRLVTDADYPHNGLSGICIAGDTMYLGVGENFGSDYELVGSDERRIKNTGGVGTIYSCKLDGSKLQREAIGFWNPFALCVAKGEIFCVDNDPDASPPCRLIHVVPEGDYGFRYEYGRAGVHPLQAWDGELPGTLPMICGTGEAPTAIVFHRGYLWVTSWGDHRIERYELKVGDEGTYTAKRTVMVQGEGDFRPTGMAVAPDGSLYFADWVDRSYPVHGKGRLWRLGLPSEMQAEFTSLSSEKQTVPAKLDSLHSQRWNGSLAESELSDLLRGALMSPDSDVRLYAVRWIAEARLTNLREDLEKLLNTTAPSDRYYLAVLAAIDWLSREPEQRPSGISDELLAQEVNNPDRTLESRAKALSLLSPEYQGLSLEELREFLKSDSLAMRQAAVHVLADRTTEDRFPLLAGIVRDSQQPVDLRADALVGLSADFDQFKQLISENAENADPTLQREAARILRLRGLGGLPTEEKPAAGDLKAWFALLEEPGDPDSGERLFFSPVGPRCSQCHRHSGRGGTVGPDLSQIGKQSSQERIITSILDPGREVAPQFQPWVLVTDEGKSFLGLRLPQSGDNGLEAYVDSTGKTFVLPSGDIAQRQPATTSIMPAGLEGNLSIQDLRDLVAFLMRREKEGK